MCFVFVYNYYNICYIYSTVGRSIGDIYDPRYQGVKRRGKYAAEVIYRGYGPTYRPILYTMVSGLQTNLLSKNASRNDAIFAQKVCQIYATTSQYVSSYGCTITMVYIVLYIIIHTVIVP